MGEKYKVNVLFKAEILSLKKYSDGTFLIKMNKPEGFEYHAGQFVMVHVNESEKPFSIASYPGMKNLELLIKMHEGGVVTPYLCNLKKGKGIDISGPFGAFSVKDTDSKEIIFIAAGTGIAPFRAMALDALTRFKDKKISIIFGFRDDLFFEEDYKKWAKKYKNFEFIGCCTGNKKGWKGRKGRVTEHLKDIIIDPEGKEVYICGMEAMVLATRDQLVKDLGFNLSQIHIEEWK